MKKYIIIAASLAACLCSCNKEQETVQAQPAQKIDFIVSIADNNTRATGTVPSASTYQSDKEKKVNDLQVLVFSNGALDGYGQASNATSVSVSCTAGSRKIYAIANGPSLSGIATEAALKAATSSLSEDDDNFVMVGSKTETVADKGSVTIDVNRVAAKIVIRKIKNNISNTALAALDFKVQRVFITNVASKFNFGGDTYAAVTDNWYNKGGYQASNNLGAFTQNIGINTSVANGATHTQDYYFYAYPNNKDYSPYADTWAPKLTMLVVQIQVGDNLYDYPIKFPVLESNKMYVLDQLEITKLGNPDDGLEGGEDEENEITETTATFSINVTDWEIQTVANKTI